jgi:hypothetical protein
VEGGQTLIAITTAPSLLASNAPNSANSAWRETVYYNATAFTVDPKAPVAEQLAARNALTNGTMKRWRDVTPGSGAYLNEVDRLEPDWQKSFWGDGCERLLRIKREMDRRDVLWVDKSVGSERWRVETFDGDLGENGKLCKVAV